MARVDDHDPGHEGDVDSLGVEVLHHLLVEELFDQGPGVEDGTPAGDHHHQAEVDLLVRLGEDPERHDVLAGGARLRGAGRDDIGDEVLDVISQRLFIEASCLQGRSAIGSVGDGEHCHDLVPNFL